MSPLPPTVQDGAASSSPTHAVEKVVIPAGENQWYDILFAASPLPMVIVDRQGHFCLDSNACTNEYYGGPLAGQPFTAIGLQPAPEQDEPRLLEACPESRVYSPGVYRWDCAKGGERYVQVVRYLIPYGNTDAALLILHDVTSQKRVESSLRLAERDLNQAQAVARLGSFVRNFINDNDRWSDQIYRNLGLDPRSTVSSYQTFLSCVHPEDRDMVHDAIARAVASRQPYSCMHRVVWPDGTVRVMQENGLVVYGKDGAAIELIGTMLDITEHQQVEKSLRQARQDLEKAQEVGHIGTWIIDATARCYEAWSKETFRIFGFPISDSAPPIWAIMERIHPEDRERIREAREQALADPTARYDVEFRIRNPKLGERTLHSQAEVQFKNGRAVRMVGMLQDITEQRLAEQKIAYLAYCDSTTGLPNRTSLEQYLEEILTSNRTGRTPHVSILLIYLERFRDINFTLGLADGDAILQQVGARIRGALDGGGFVARVGNSQFAAVLPDVEVARAAPFIRQVFAVLDRPFRTAGINYQLGAHIGVSGATRAEENAKTLLRHAHVAQYQARQAGKAYAVYDAEHDPYNPRRLALIGEFRKSIKAGELQLYCQPKVDIRSGRLSGAESLVRWHHPTLGLIPPDHFVPQIESTDLIHDLTRFMLDASVKQCLAWRKQGFLLPLAVNLSPRNLLDTDFVTDLKGLLDSSQLEPESLGLEITESSLIADPQHTIAELTRLKSMGFRLFVDDFGTGYSSLSYLISLPVDVIKIDHSFTMHMIERRNCATVVKSTIDLAHSLGMKVVAEGTANKDIWNALADFGCDECQGHYVSPPLPAAEFFPWSQSSGYAVASV